MVITRPSFRSVRQEMLAACIRYIKYACDHRVRDLRELSSLVLLDQLVDELAQEAVRLRAVSFLRRCVTPLPAP
jgi:hypothetical protein